jgi:osmoprotectant transport system permease protein
MKSWNPVLLSLSVFSALALLFLPFVWVAPNRLVSGQPFSFLTALNGWYWVLPVCWLLNAYCATLKASKSTQWFVVVCSAGLMSGMVALAGQYAQLIAVTESSIARTSLGGGFWVVVALCWLTAADSLQRLKVNVYLRVVVTLMMGGPIAMMLAWGWCDDLSIMKEYANRADMFGASVGRHIQIVLVSLIPIVILGLPLGWGASRLTSFRQALFPVLNIIQTLPSIALFGLLMAPLAWMAQAFPLLGQAGISGIGLAPGVIALVLYGLLPVVRGTLAGLQQVPTGVIQAAQGMGMSSKEIFLKVEVPLALPVVLTGLHTATVQAVGLAAITALIGAGGLGSIMFEGLFSSAQDLVLLGVVPIVLLAVITDSAFKVFISLIRGYQS